MRGIAGQLVAVGAECLSEHVGSASGLFAASQVQDVRVADVRLRRLERVAALGDAEAAYRLCVERARDQVTLLGMGTWSYGG